VRIDFSALLTTDGLKKTQLVRGALLPYHVNSEQTAAQRSGTRWPGDCSLLGNGEDPALASNEEAQVRLRDGIDCEYFTEAECELAFELGRRSGAAIMGLLKSLDDLPPSTARQPRKR
jgi:hypothetical protein